MERSLLEWSTNDSY